MEQNKNQKGTKNSTKTASKNAPAHKKTGSKNAYSDSWGSQSECGCSTLTEFAQEMCMLNDADIISDVLATQKGLVKMYGTALCETDCENLRGILNTQLSECADDQFDSFLYMNERGLYPTEQAPAPKVKEAKKLFASKEKTFDL